MGLSTMSLKDLHAVSLTVGLVGLRDRAVARAIIDLVDLLLATVGLLQ